MWHWFGLEVLVHLAVLQHIDTPGSCEELRCDGWLQLVFECCYGDPNNMCYTLVKKPLDAVSYGAQKSPFSLISCVITHYI